MKDRLFVVESDERALRAVLLVDRKLEAIEIDHVSRPTRVGAVATAQAIRNARGLGSIVKLADGGEMLLERGRFAALPAAGDRVTVQVTREPRGDKLGLVSRTVARAGRAVIHLPLETGISKSRRLEAGPEERALLEVHLAGKPGGWILRGTAQSIAPEDYRAEIAALAAEGDQIRAATPACAAPDAFRRLVSDYGLPSPEEIQVFGRAAERSVDAWCMLFAPSLVGRVERHSGPRSLFDLHDLDGWIMALKGPRVPLPAGGSLVIEPTEALTVIDVNGGGEANPLAVNLAAAAEIGRQLRLRHIGGIIVIDFVSLNRPADRSRTEQALRQALAADPARTHVLPMSGLGLMEMTRERRGPELELNI